MFRPRHSLLVLPLLALLISAIPAHAMTISDAQLSPFSTPGPHGPYISKDWTTYICNVGDTSPVIMIRYWEPGYRPLGSQDETNMRDDIGSNSGTVSNDEVPHNYYNMSIESNIRTYFRRDRFTTGSASLYEVRLDAYSTGSGPSVLGHAYGGIYSYTF